MGLLENAFTVANETGSQVDAGQAMCSLAEVHLGTEQYAEAEDEARQALELLGDRVDYLYEIGTAQLSLGRALLELDRLIEAEEMLVAADSSFEQSSSVSHRAAAWVAQGDLAQKRGASMRRPGSTGGRPRRCRTSASSERRHRRCSAKGTILYFVVAASLVLSIVGAGFADGH